MIVSINVVDEDFSVISEEISILVDKYLYRLEMLKSVDRIGLVNSRINAVLAYWERMKILLKYCEENYYFFDGNGIIERSLQGELKVLEGLYLKFEEGWDSVESCEVLRSILLRMDEVLLSLGFSIMHRDRIFIHKLMLQQLIKMKSICGQKVC